MAVERAFCAFTHSIAFSPWTSSSHRYGSASSCAPQLPVVAPIASVAMAAPMTSCRLTAPASPPHTPPHLQECPQAERDVLDAPVDEEGRRGAHTAVQSALQLLAHALQVNLVVHLRDVAG